LVGALELAISVSFQCFGVESARWVRLLVLGG
jgi:hypothetical protein